MSNTLPPNATELERTLAGLALRATQLPVPIRSLHSPADCPVAALPWLAWARSVDHWDEAWSEAQKRAVISASFAVHQTKGTPYAVKHAIAAVGYRVKLQSWWQYSGDPYTFKVTVYINDRPIDNAALQSIHQMIQSAKNERSGYLLQLATEAKAPLNIAAAVLTARRVRVEPWQATESSAQAAISITSTVINHQKVRVLPWQ